MRESSYNPKVLELVAKEIGDYFTGTEIVKILKEVPIPREHIQYPNTKWWTINEAFKYIQTNSNNPGNNPDDKISKLITAFLHPLNHGLNMERADKLLKNLEKILKYSNYHIVESDGFSPEVCHYEQISDVITNHEDPETEYDDKQVIIANLEQIKTIRDNHQIYIDVLELFCSDIKKPTAELNKAYLVLKDKIMNSIGKLNLQTHDTGIYVPFKGDLYTAEIEWNGSGAIDDIKLGPKLSWDAIRPSLYRVHSQITKLFNIAVGDSKMTEDEKTLENIRTLISEKRYPKPIPNKKKEAMEIKIVGMPDLNVKNIDERAIIKNKKKITLPSFPRTEWAKVSIKFIDDRNILLSDGKETKPSSFEGLGCSDTRSDKPDDIWEFLIKVARGSGSTPPVKKNVREKQTKQKQKITDILRNIFDNDTDPFEKEGEGIYKAKFHIEYLIQESISTEPNRKYLDLEEMRNEMTTPKDDSKDNEFS